MASVSLEAPSITILNKSAQEPYQELIKKYGSPLLVIDPDVLTQSFNRLSSALPGVHLYFAMKANPDPLVIQTLASCGAYFDIATSGEIQLLRNAKVDPERCIHTHPIKRDQDIKDALRYGCTSFVVDNLDEIKKFTAYRTRVGLLLRVSFPNPASPVDLSKKFGCTPNQVFELAEQAAQLGLHVNGLSFHAGSQCVSPHNHILAINRCADLLLEYNNTHEHNMSILDIGGGFPAQYDETTPDIETFCGPIKNALDKLPEQIRIIAEPGRFLVAEAVTSIASIIGAARRANGMWYYLDDGVYGSYSGRIYDHANYPLTIFSDLEETSAATFAGPTCDSIDVFAENIATPELSIGDIVVGKVMGAYTNASATDFNLFPRAKVISAKIG